jgi:hypothetical protein
MARGLGGDDGPSLFMFIAVILIWGSIKDWFSRASDKVEDTLGGNLPNPLQAETKKQIQDKEKRVAATQNKVRYSTLPHPVSYYQQIADDFFEEMGSWFNVDKTRMLARCKMLSADELKAVYVAFDVRDNNLLGVAQSTGTLLDWFGKLYSGDQKAEMKKVWAKTGLWD